MAAISGENGAVFWNEELTDTATSGTLVFSAAKTISSCGAVLNFATEGYSSGMLVTVSGCVKDVTSSGSTVANNRIFTITDVTAGVLTVSEAVTAATPEAAGVTFTEADPGIEVIGFYNWSVSYAGDVLETSNFSDSSGGRTYVSGLTGWTVTADKYFQTVDTELDEWLGDTCEVRCFLNYVATPSTGSPSQYWDGDTVVTGLDHTTPRDSLVTRSISFQGDRALTLKTQTKAWNLGLS